MGGTINIEAAADGIRGKDYTAVKGGTVTITAAGDGIRAGNDRGCRQKVLLPSKAVRL